MALDLSPGERIIWQGQPTQGFRFSPQDVLVVPFAAVWLFLVLSILTLALKEPMQEADPLIYVVLSIFTLFGLYMLVGRFVIDRAARRRTHFYLTPQRAVIERGLLRQTRRTIGLATAPEISVRGRRNGRGTIRFGSPTLLGLMPPSWPGASQFLPPAFDDIENADHVYELALSAQREAQSRHSGDVARK